MLRNTGQNLRIRKSGALRAAGFAIVVTSFGLQGANARAASTSPIDLRIVAAHEKFDNTWQSAAGYKKRSPRRLRARHLELALGMILTSQETRPFVSFGPVWRVPMARGRMFVDLGLSPTLIGGSHINGREIGGVFHFTSFVTAGANFGSYEQLTVSLRIQHLSNGGLHGTNPGLDMAGISFSYDFDK